MSITVLRIVSSLGPTSNIYDRFSLYRSKHFPDEKEIILVLNRKSEENLTVNVNDGYQNIKILGFDGNKIKFIKYCKKIIRELSVGKESVIAHIHHPKAGLLLIIGNFLSGKKIPVIFTIHSTFHKYAKKTKLITIANYIFSDKVTFVGEYAYFSFKKSVFFLNFDKSEVVSNGIDFESINNNISAKSTNDLVFDNKKYILIAVGRMIRDKNMDFLIRVVSRLPANFELVIAGEGPERGNLEKIVKSYGLYDRVKFPGYLSKDELYKLISKASVFLSASLREGMPISVFEAMTLKVPVLLSNIGPHREIITEKYHRRYLIDFEENSWVNVIRRVVREGDNKDIKEFVEANYEILEKKYTLSTMHENYSRIYRKTLNEMRKK